MARKHSFAWLFSAVLMTGAQPSAASSTVSTVESMRKYSKYVVVAKVLGTELTTGTFGNATAECGAKVRIEVLESLSGQAPRFLTVRFLSAPPAGALYFIPVDGRGPYVAGSDSTQIPSPTEEYWARETCRANEPELRTWDDAAQIVSVTVDRGGKPVTTQWLRKPLIMKVPAGLTTYEFPPLSPIATSLGGVRARLMPSTLRFGATFVSWPELRQAFLAVPATR